MQFCHQAKVQNSSVAPDKEGLRRCSRVKGLSIDLANLCSDLLMLCRYVAVSGAHLLNGALTAAANGSMVISGSIVGQGMYLSAFYAHITPQYGKSFWS